MIDNVSEDVKTTTSCSTRALPEIESCQEYTVSAEHNCFARHLHDGKLGKRTSDRGREGYAYVYTKRQGSRCNDNPQITFSKQNLNAT